MVADRHKLGALMLKCVRLKRNNFVALDATTVLGAVLSGIEVCVFLTSSIWSCLSDCDIDPVVLTELPSYAAYTASIRFDVAYTPINNITVQIMGNLSYHVNIASELSNLDTRGMETEAALEVWLEEQSTRKDNLQSTFAVKMPDTLGIIFETTNIYTQEFLYTIKSNANSQLNLISTVKYLDLNLLHFQLYLDREIMRAIGIDVKENFLFFGPLSINEVEEESISILFFGLYIFFTFDYIVLVISLLNEVLSEKNTTMTDYLKVSGVPAWMIWLHWLVYALIDRIPALLLFNAIVAIVIPNINLVNIVILSLHVLMYTINIVLLQLVLTQCLKNKNAVYSISTCGWIIIHALSLWVLPFMSYSPFILQLMFCFLPLNNLIWVYYTLSSFYGQWSPAYIFSSGFGGSAISIGVSLGIFVLEIGILIFILKILDLLRPLTHGVKPLYFKKFWGFGKRNSLIQMEYMQMRASLLTRTQPILTPKTTSVELQKVILRSKEEDINKEIILQNIDLEILEGEIFVIVGHKGAGKTSLMSLIAGVFPPSSGDLLFYGESICSNGMRPKYQEKVGYCSQMSAYFPKLSVFEHLQFFGQLKGLSLSEANRKGQTLLKKLKVTLAKDTAVEGLSKFEQRKVNLAISLIGDPSVLVLDELTASLDLQSQKELGNIILSMRGERTIVIATDSMEEAEVLGDRIAILNHGLIVCCGTPIYLKLIYNIGYRVNITADFESFSEIEKIVNKYVSGHNIEIQPNNTIKLLVPWKNKVNHFPELFEELEYHSTDLKITGVSVVCTTLEDVFIQSGEEAVAGDPLKITTSIHQNRPNQNKLEGFRLLYQQVCTLFYKRFLMRVTNIWGDLFWFSLPCLIALVLSIITALHSDSLKARRESFARSVSIRFLKPVIPLVYDNSGLTFAHIATDYITSNQGKVIILENDVSINDSVISVGVNNFNKYYETLVALQFVDQKVYFKYLEHTAHNAANLVSNILLRSMANNSRGEIKMHSQAYAIATTVKNDCNMYVPHFINVLQNIWKFLFSLLLSSSIVVCIPCITKERTSDFKQQQFITGVSPLVFWIVNLLFDYISHLFLSMLYVLTITLFAGEIAFIPGFLSTVLFVLSFYGLSGLLFSYLFSNIFNNYIIASSTFVLFEIIETISSLVLYDSPSVWPISQITIGLLSLNPLLPATMTTHDLLYAAGFMYSCQLCEHLQTCEEIVDIFSLLRKQNNWSLVAYETLLILYSFLYFIILILIDRGILTKFTSNFWSSWLPPFQQFTEETDVKYERELVSALRSRGDVATALRVEGLTKIHVTGCRTVDNVTFMVSAGECFGVVGVNGAGKSTLLKLLATDLFTNEGDVQIFKYSMQKDSQSYKKCIGYCPATNSVYKPFSGQEVLRIIGLLRGIPHQRINEEVAYWLRLVGMSMIAGRPCQEYSDGTMRKLCTVMAFIGNPPVVLLDEPTTGIDPISRRNIWDLIQAQTMAGQAIILTTNNMRECEHLCTRITIMREGKMKCIGTNNYLWSKYSHGLTVLVKLGRPTSTYEREMFKLHFMRLLPMSVLIDESPQIIHYHLLDSGLSLSRLFTELLVLKDTYSIVTFISTNETNVENHFLKFGKTEVLGQRYRPLVVHRRQSIYEQERRMSNFDVL